MAVVLLLGRRSSHADVSRSRAGTSHTLRSDLVGDLLGPLLSGQLQERLLDGAVHLAERVEELDVVGVGIDVVYRPLL